MLNSIERYEQANLKNLIGDISNQAYAKIE